MVYLNNKTEAQQFFIPRTGITGTGSSMTLVLRNTTSLKEYEFAVADLETSRLYHNLSISLDNDMPDGEYEYNLREDEDTIGNGILYIGDFTKPEEYQKEIQYTQYGAE